MEGWKIGYGEYNNGIKNGWPEKVSSRIGIIWYKNHIDESVLGLCLGNLTYTILIM